MGVSRRQLLQWGAGTAALGAGLAPNAYGNQRKRMSKIEPEHRTLKLYNLHTNERAHVAYWENGEYNVDALAELYWLLRDHRQNEVIAIDTRLLDELHQISQTLDHRQEIHVLSAFRSQQTNTMLRQKNDKVAKHSLHIKGQALDFYIPKLHIKHLHNAALAKTSGGVGYYPDNGFVHLDVGRKRRWVS